MDDMDEEEETGIEETGIPEFDTPVGQAYLRNLRKIMGDEKVERLIESMREDEKAKRKVRNAALRRRRYLWWGHP